MIELSTLELENGHRACVRASFEGDTIPQKLLNDMYSFLFERFPSVKERAERLAKAGQEVRAEVLTRDNAIWVDPIDDPNLIAIMAFGPVGDSDTQTYAYLLPVISPVQPN